MVFPPGVKMKRRNIAGMSSALPSCLRSWRPSAPTPRTHPQPTRPIRRRRLNKTGRSTVRVPIPNNFNRHFARPIRDHKACRRRQTGARPSTLPLAGSRDLDQPEVDQGFGLGNSFGVAGYVSGEAYKLGQNDPYYRTSRAFFRQTINLGGETQKVDPDLN
jgi:high affinity Mn2+ porin